MSTAAAETAKNGAPTTKEDVAKVSEIKELGWSVDGGGTEWKAHEKAGDLRSVGPARSIKALHTMVMLAAGPPAAKPANGKGTGKAVPATADDDKAFELTNESDTPARGKTVKVKQPTLPNVQNAVLEDLRTAILELRDNTMEILRRQKIQEEQQATVKAMMHKFEDELSTDPETGFQYFQAEMVIADLVIETKEKVKTRTAKAG